MPDSSEPLVQDCPACGTSVNVTGIEPLAAIACPSCGQEFHVQRAFDHFELVETLGVGGMGSVYKARDSRLDRFVALKLLHKELSANPAEAALLEKEARLTAAVNHPNVVQVYSAGHAHGQIYLVMELVDHGSLDDLMAKHPRLPEAQVLRTGIEAARGLQAAYEKGLIHRDVKPANILFASSGAAKIGDFGLAVAAGQKTEAQKEIWGTPYYVAPERLNNEPEDFRSDIYSLGATLFHALAGRPPIEGETTGASELRKLKNNPPDLRSLAPEVSKETARIIQQTLAPDPANRFGSYAEFIAQLEQAGASPNDSSPKKNGAWPLLVILLSLLAAGAAAYFLTQPKVPISAPAATPAALSPTPDLKAAAKRKEEADRQAAEREKQRAAAQKTAAEKKAREAERPRLLAAETPAWQAALTNARADIARYDFPAALSAIDAAKVTEPSLVEAQSNEHKKIAWLIDWKNRLIADINAGHFRAEVPLGPTKYTGAARADQTQITFRLPPYGTAPVEWTKIAAPTLLAISLSVFNENAPDAADRQWRAAVFAAETNEADAAKALAEKAAQAKPEYREQIGLLAPEN